MNPGRSILHLLSASAACALAFALGILFAETRQVVQARLERQAALQLVRQAPQEVACARLEARPHAQRLEATGTIQAWRSARLAFAESGLVREVLVDVGDPVAGPRGDEPGQALARLDLERFQAVLDSAAADLAKADWDLAQLEPLLKQGTISQEEWRRAGLVCELKRAGLVAARKSLADAVLRAPFSGIIVARSVEAGEAAAPAAPAFRLAELDRVKAVVRVPGARIGELAAGQAAEARVSLGRDRTHDLRGTVHRICPSGEGLLFPVEIELENPDLLLREGLLVRVAIHTATLPRLFVVPLEAVIERRGARLVMLYVEHDRIVAGRFDLGKLPGEVRERVCGELGLGAAKGRWHPVSEARWEAAGLTARERVLARAGSGSRELPEGPGVEVFRVGATARERELPGAWIEGDRCLVPDDGSLKDGERLIVRGQHRLADGAEVVLAERNELPLPGAEGVPGDGR